MLRDAAARLAGDVRLLRHRPGQPRADRGPRRGGPARGRERARRGSPATCTTCSATRSRRSRSRPGWPAGSPSGTRSGRRGEIAEVEELARSRAHRRPRRGVRLPRRRPWPASWPALSEVLRAAGIEAELPRADRGGRPGARRAVRLGGAGGRHERGAPLPAPHTCTIAVGHDWLEIDDDGLGGAAGTAGNGPDRAARAGRGRGRHRPRRGGPRGWRLRVEMGAPAPALPRSAVAGPAEVLLGRRVDS